MDIDHKKDLGSYLTLSVMFLIAIILNFLLPSGPMVIFRDASGAVLGLGSKQATLFMLPFLSMLFYVILTYIPRFAVYKKSMKHFHSHYTGFKLAFMLYMFFVYVAILLPSFGIFVDVSFITTTGLATLLFYLGYVLNFTEINFFFGVRTPWTLTSSSVWKKTNHLASILFRIVAFFVYFSIFFQENKIYYIVVPIIVSIIYLFFYSYMEYQKQAKEGTLVLAKSPYVKKKPRKRSR